MHIFKYKDNPTYLMAMRDFAKLFKSLSDETRIRILKVLLERECCVCEVMQALDISQSRASRNLGILEDAGFIKSKRDGLWIVYSIDEQKMNSYAVSLIKLLRGSLVNEEIILQDRERLSHAVRVGPKAIPK
jgi:ArsR family transcriptional regulator, arsenate/arsenite/antimonite-responsive transcriptional repressor